MDENEYSVSEPESEVSGDDWDDIDLSDAPTEAEGESAAEAEAEPADQPEEAEAEAKEEETGEAENAAQEEAQGTDQSFELKHLDEVKTVDRDEVIALAQKGLDYDRIRERYESAKEKADWYAENEDSIAWLESLAEEQGISFSEMVDNTRAQVMANRTRKSLDECRGIVANERKAAELARREKAIGEKAAAAETQDAAKERMQADVRAFAAEYPDIARDPEKNIPKEVWNRVHDGETLLNAYRAWENKQLKEQLAKEKAEAEKRKQEEKNKSRSTGSQKSTGKRSDMDEFDQAWYDGT